MTARRASLGIGLVALILLASGCGNDGAQLARSSCHHVLEGLSYFDQSEAVTTPARMRADQLAALDQFKEALPLAARAALADGRWQALMTTLQDASRVPVANLVPALDADCSDALGRTISQQG